jgi:hypothetical protein
MINYEQYFKICQDNFSGSKPHKSSLLFIDNLGCETFDPKKKNKYFDFYKDYDDDVNKAFSDINRKIKNKLDLFDTSHENIIKVDNWKDCQSFYRLGKFCARLAEENVYGSNAIVESVLVYKNLLKGPKRSSWLWHYDDNVHHQIKVMIYLNDVTDTTGAMQVLKKEDGSSTKFLSSKISPTKTDKSKQVFGTSRIPKEFIKKQNVETISGKKGTLIIFDPNTPHRATLASQEETRCCVVFNLRPYHKNSKKIDETTKTWSTLGNVKKFSTSTE